jgi:hypothetical protein
MAKQFDALTADHQAFLLKQKVFFTASGTADSRINLSPKGLDCLRVLDDRRICWMDLTGSGAETAAHMAADGRLTVMTCAFEGTPLILRLYGRGSCHRRGTPTYAGLLAEAFGGVEITGARQIVELSIDLVQTSCGFGVPVLTFESERQILPRWAEKQGEEGVAKFQAEKNRVSIDGLPTGLGD